jgi:hypothetical protein
LTHCVFLTKQYFICEEQLVVRIIVCLQGSENPHDVIEHEFDSLLVNVWCALMKEKVISHLFFEELMVTGETSLAMIDNSAFWHVPLGAAFQLDGAPPHFFCCVHYLFGQEVS